jgi:hypothetical protein
LVDSPYTQFVGSSGNDSPYTKFVNPKTFTEPDKLTPPVENPFMKFVKGAAGKAAEFVGQGIESLETHGQQFGKDIRQALSDVPKDFEAGYQKDSDPAGKVLHGLESAAGGLLESDPVQDLQQGVVGSFGAEGGGSIAERPITQKPAGLFGQQKPIKTLPTSPSQGVPATPIAKPQTPPPQPTAGLPGAPPPTINLQGMGSGIAASMYDGMFKSLQKGSTVFAGIHDNFLVRAKPHFDRGLIKTPEDLAKFAKGHPDFSESKLKAQAIAAMHNAGLKQAQIQPPGAAVEKSLDLPPGTIKDPEQITPVPRSIGAQVSPPVPVHEAMDVHERAIHNNLKKEQVYGREALDYMKAANERVPDPEAKARLYNGLADGDNRTGFTPEDIKEVETHIDPAREEVKQLYKQNKTLLLNHKIDPDEVDLLEAWDTNSLPRVPVGSNFAQVFAGGEDHLLGGAIRKSLTSHETGYDTMVSEHGHRVVIHKGEKNATGVRDGEIFQGAANLKRGETIKKDGIKWHMERGYPSEIEDQLGVPQGSKYIRDPHLALAYSKAALKIQQDKIKQLIAMKNDPNLKLVPKFQKAPANYRTTKFPGMGYYKGPPRVMDVLDRFAPKDKGGVWDAISQVSRAITSSMFLDPAFHLFNTAQLALQNVGWHSLNPLRYPGSMIDFAQAAKHVHGITPFYKELYKHGFMEALRDKNLLTVRQMQRAAAKHWKADPAGTGMAAFAKKVGMSPVSFYKAWLNASTRTLWSGSDVMSTWRAIRNLKDVNKQAGRAPMDHAGIEQAVKLTAKDVPDYFVPTHLWEGPGGKMASSILRASPLNVFGTYKYNLDRGIYQMIRDTVSPNATASERSMAIGKIVNLVMMKTAMEMADDMYHKSSGNRDKIYSSHGSFAVIDPAIELARKAGGNKPFDISDTLKLGKEVALNPSPLVQAGITGLTGRHYPFGNPVFTNKPTASDRLMNRHVPGGEMFRPYKRLEGAAHNVSQAGEAAGETLFWPYGEYQKLKGESLGDIARSLTVGIRNNPDVPRRKKRKQ